MIRYVKEFRGIFHIMNSLAEKNEAVIVAGFVEKGLGLSQFRSFPLGFFILI